MKICLRIRVHLYTANDKVPPMGKRGIPCYWWLGNRDFLCVLWGWDENGHGSSVHPMRLILVNLCPPDPHPLI